MSRPASASSSVLPTVLATVLRSRTAAVVASTAVLTAGIQLGGALAAPQSPAPVTVTREALASAGHPRGADHRTLGLSKVTVMPGTTLALHHHPGTQIGYVQSGVLTYTVEHGSVTVRSGDSSAPHVVRRITSSHAARLHAGQWIVEQPGMVHRAANRTGRRVVILLATLFSTGAPASSPAH